MDAFRVALAIAIPLAAFTTGLGARPRAGSYLPQRPGLAFRSLLAILVLVPIWTLLFEKLVHPTGNIAAGLWVAILAVGIGPAAAMKRMDEPSPRTRYAFELNLLVVAASIVFIPMAVAVVARLYGRSLALAPGDVAKVVLVRALIPMALGALVARVFPGFAARSHRYLALVVNLVLAVVMIFALLAIWRDLLSVGARGWLAATTVAMGAMIIGHLLGGPDDDTRGVLAAASTLRFPALAFMLAKLTPQPQQVLPEVLAYVIASLVLMGLYGLFFKTSPARAPGEKHRRGKPVGGPAEHRRR